MRFLITGGTGFIGKSLASRLLAEGHHLKFIGRHPLPADDPLSAKVEFFTWQLQTEVPPPELFDGIDTIIHLAGEGIAHRRWTHAQKRKIYESRILGTRNLVTALKSLKKGYPQSFVAASAIGFYGDREDEILTEASSRGEGFLSDVCVDWEREIFRASDITRTVVLRIGLVLGRGGGALPNLQKIFRLGLGGPIGKGTQWLSWIHLDDVVSLLKEAAVNPIYRGVINGVSPQPVTNKDFSHALGRAMNRPAFLAAPAPVLKMLMGELSTLVLSSQRVIPAVASGHGFKFHHESLPQALKEIVGFL